LGWDETGDDAWRWVNEVDQMNTTRTNG